LTRASEAAYGFPHVPDVEHRFVDAGGLRMHVAEVGAGVPVLMLHGWPQHWYMWRRVIPLLAPHARLICPDLRGFGWTQVAGSGYDRWTMARDVLALLDALEVEQAHVIGHDWGGWIGFLLATDTPERVSRLLALGVAPPWPSRNPRHLRELWRIGYQLPLSAPFIGRALVERRVRPGLRRASAAFTEENLDAFASRLRGERARASELLYRTFLLRELPQVARGRYVRAPLKVPTLLMLGERDPVIASRAVLEQAEGSPALEVEIVPGAGHFIVDERPALVAERAISLFAL
jgi:pimeloyl-ACP methyl ester carboxylesterase